MYLLQKNKIQKSRAPVPLNWPKYYWFRTPALAIIPPETKRTLERLTNISDCHIAVISGRDLENLQVHILKKGMAMYRLSHSRHLGPGPGKFTGTYSKKRHGHV